MSVNIFEISFFVFPRSTWHSHLKHSQNYNLSNAKEQTHCEISSLTPTPTKENQSLSPDPISVPLNDEITNVEKKGLILQFYLVYKITPDKIFEYLSENL